jgi:hypothetical protein
MAVAIARAGVGDATSLQKMLGILPPCGLETPRGQRRRLKQRRPIFQFFTRDNAPEHRPAAIVAKTTVCLPRPREPAMSPSCVPQIPHPKLPQLVAAYVQAINTFDLEGLLAAFADDALVNDQLRDYWGKSAIREWAERDIIGERLTMHVVKIVEHYGNFIVTANVDGNYDKRGLPDPLVLAFYFSAHGDLIVQLLILRNQFDI